MTLSCSRKLAGVGDEINIGLKNLISRAETENWKETFYLLLIQYFSMFAIFVELNFIFFSGIVETYYSIKVSFRYLT